MYNCWVHFYKIINSHRYITLIMTFLHAHFIARELLSFFFFAQDSATVYIANIRLPCLQNILVTG
jgi:hypothetical protein